MKQLSMRAGLTAAALAAAALLAGCGGGGGGDEDAGGNSQVPASALQSSEGLAAFQNSLNTNGTDATSVPLNLGDEVLPTSDTTEPLAVS